MFEFLNNLEEWGVFSSIRNSAYAYPVLLWLHLLGLAVWGASMLMTDAQLLGVGSKLLVANGLRRIQWSCFGLAAATGALLFGANAGLYAHNPWFWVKLGLLALLMMKPVLVRAGQARAAAGFSLVLLLGALGAARGPATVKDIMHSMVDPTGDFLFSSVQQIADDTGIHEVAPETDAQWGAVNRRLDILVSAADLLSVPGIRAAHPRDRSQNPEIENEPAEVEALLRAKGDDFRLRAANLRQAANTAKRAVNAKDKDALSQALVGIDQACEVCHLLYWYPKDQRAREAAREAGILP